VGAGARGGVDAGGLEVATDRERGVEPGGLEDDDDHAGGGGLTVGAGDRDADLAGHQQGQELGAAEDGDAEAAGGDQLRVAGPDRGRGHHQVGPAEPVAVVAGVDVGAEGAEAGEGGGLGPVGAGDGVPGGQQQAGQAAHAGAADADQVHGPPAAAEVHPAHRAAPPSPGRSPPASAGGSVAPPPPASGPEDRALRSMGG
jgi:hypothetical protein